MTNDVQNEEVINEDEPKVANRTIDKKNKGIENKTGAEVRKSQRIRKQRMVIHPDQIGDCDDTQDPDYR